jgi:hypothetical protein
VVAVVAGAPELVLEVVQALEPALQVFAKPAGSRAGRGFARRVEHASGGSVRKGSVGSGVRADVLRVASTCGECQSIASQDSQDSGVGPPRGVTTAHIPCVAWKTWRGGGLAGALSIRTVVNG